MNKVFKFLSSQERCGIVKTYEEWGMNAYDNSNPVVPFNIKL